MQISKCKICDKDTYCIYGIDFKAVSICEDCAAVITKQNVTWLIDENLKRCESQKKDVCPHCKTVGSLSTENNRTICLECCNLIGKH